MVDIWIVWEANANVPQVFSAEAAAITYRNGRVRQVKHPVYIRPALLPDAPK